MKSKLVEDIKRYKSEIKTLAKNTVEFIETTALLITTSFAIYGSLHYQLRTEYKYAVLYSGVVVAFIAVNLLRKFLLRK